MYRTIRGSPSPKQAAHRLTILLSESTTVLWMMLQKGTTMSKDGPASGGIYYSPFYKPRHVSEINADLRSQKLIRRACELAEVLRTQGLTAEDILKNPEIKDIASQLADLSRSSGTMGSPGVKSNDSIRRSATSRRLTAAGSTTQGRACGRPTMRSKRWR